jgi:hypothetical protein
MPEMILPAWAIAFLLWSNGFLVAALLALVIRQKGIDTLKLGLEAQITGARTAVEAQVRSEATNRNQTYLDLHGRLEKIEGQIGGKNGLTTAVDRIGAGIDALISLFLRHGEKMGIDTNDLRALEEHR